MSHSRSVLDHAIEEMRKDPKNKRYVQFKYSEFGFVCGINFFVSLTEYVTGGHDGEFLQLSDVEELNPNKFSSRHAV